MHRLRWRSVRMMRPCDAPVEVRCVAARASTRFRPDSPAVAGLRDERVSPSDPPLPAGEEALHGLAARCWRRLYPRCRMLLPTIEMAADLCCPEHPHQ